MLFSIYLGMFLLLVGVFVVCMAGIYRGKQRCNRDMLAEYVSIQQKRKEEQDKQQKKLDVLLHNIEVYDGTQKGQREVEA